MKALREMGIKHLLCEGGSNLNGDMIRNGFIDELFLTLAPKIKLGTSLPTYAGGDPLPENEILNFDLVESHVIENEIFVRYRIRP
jgi:riboflavin biosynthesis pyrimidine reductase